MTRRWANPYDILDQNGQYCGLLLLDSKKSHTLMLSKAQEFAILSRDNNRGSIQFSLRGLDLSDPQCRLKDPYLSREYFWVILIEWINGIAERRGFGQIHSKALENSYQPGPTWKEYILG